MCFKFFKYCFIYSLFVIRNSYFIFVYSLHSIYCKTYVNPTDPFTKKNNKMLDIPAKNMYVCCVHKGFFLFAR